MKSKVNIETISQQKEFVFKILDFMADQGPTHERFLFDEFKKIIVEGYDKQNWRGLKMAIADIIDLAKDLPPSAYNELNAVLHKAFGRTIDDAKANDQKKIKAIIKRGEILNADEYRLIESRIDEIYADPKRQAELDVLNQLLIDVAGSNKKFDD